MMVVDTSALMAILQAEPQAAACREAIAGHEDLLIAAPTLAEAMIVAARRGLHGEMARLIHSLSLTVLPLTEGRAYDAANGYRRWGKGFQKARLNFGDCFAYALAREHDCPLLFVGDDFAKTDVAAAI